MARLKNILIFIFGIYLFSILSFSYFPNAHTCNTCSSDNACSIAEQKSDENSTNINDIHTCLLCVLISTAHKIISNEIISFDSNQTSVNTCGNFNKTVVFHTYYNNLKVRAPPFFS